MNKELPTFEICKLCVNVVAENEFPGEVLRSLNSLTSHLFMIETGNVRKLGEVRERLKALLAREDSKELIRGLGIWSL